MSSPNAWGSLRERGGDGHLFWIMLGVWLNSSMDPDRDSSCCGLVLWEEVRLLVGLSGRGGGWSWVEARRFAHLWRALSRVSTMK